MTWSQEKFFKHLSNKRLMAMLPIGIASGLPLALSSGTLQAWLTTAGLDIKSIGLFSLAGLPYTLKFLWSPLLDRFTPPMLDRRRGWMFIFQAALVLTILFMAMHDPHKSLVLFGMSAFLMALFSASQDIVIDAYRTDLLHASERGLGAGLSVTAYRLAMLISGAFALILGDHIGWQNTYILMASILGILWFITPWLPSPMDAHPPSNLALAIKGPIRDMLSRPYAIGFLLLIVLYKLGDAFCGTLTTAFLIRGAGFSPTDVGVINKGMGLAATIGGAIAGGALVARMGLFRSLFAFGLLQAVSNLSFLWLALAGKSYPLLIIAVGIENLSGGMGTASFVAFLMALCTKRYSATQFALLTALASIGRVVVGPPAGIIVAHTSWPIFFLLTALSAIPGIWLVYVLREEIERLDH